jgi:hypothetical protein
MDSEGNLTGRLKPLAFTFSTTQPTVAMRISAGSKMPMDFVLYTLSDKLYFVPGASIVYSDTVNHDTINNVPSLLKYDGEGQWLSKSIVTMDPSTIQEDLTLHRASNNIVIADESSAVIPNANLVPVSSGIVLSSKGSAMTIGEDTQSSAPMIGNRFLLKARLLFLGVAILLIAVIVIFKKRHRKNFTPYGKSWSFFSKQTFFTAAIPDFILVSSLVLYVGHNLLNSRILYLFLGSMIALYLASYVVAVKKCGWITILKVLAWQIFLAVLTIAFALFYSTHTKDFVLLKAIFTL